MYTVKPMSDNPAEEFRYYWREGMDLRPTPPLQTEEPAWGHLRHTLFDAYHHVADTWDDPVMHTDMTRLLDDHWWQDDELMHNVVDTFARDKKKARADFKLALEEGIDKVDNPSEELVVLFDQLDNLPEWFDRESAERGRVAYYNVIPAAEEIAIAFSFYGTIMEDRTSAATAETHMFDFQPLKRSLETTKMLASIGLWDIFDRFSIGFQSAVNVRLIHAQANRGLTKLWGDSHYNRFGCPVPSSAVSTGVGWFALVPLAADELFGRQHTEQEWNDLAMYWAYMLYIMGVEDEIIPKNAEDMRRQIDYLFAGAGDGNKFRIEMADALFLAMERADADMPYKSMGAVSLLVGRDAVTHALRDTRWENPKIDEYAAALREAGEEQAKEAIEADAQPGAEERRRERAQGDTPPWMTRHRGVLAAIEHAELPVKADFTGHDAVHEQGAVVPKAL